MCSSVLIDIYHRYYHVKQKVSTRLSDSVIVKPYSENKGHHHIKDPWTLSEVVCDEVKKINPLPGFLIES